MICSISYYNICYVCKVIISISFTDNEYVPNINKELNCNFVKTEHCNNFWKLDGWHHSKVEAFAYKPILDTRWECKYKTIIKLLYFSSLYSLKQKMSFVYVNIFILN